MKGAQLWREILNNGLDDDLSADGQGEIEREIITSPLIVDTRPTVEGRLMEWKLFKRFSIPFPMFWIEGKVSGALGGALIEATPADDGTDLQLCVVVSTGAKPWLLGVHRVKLDKAGDLVLHEDGRRLGTQFILSRRAKAKDSSPGNLAQQLSIEILHDALDTLFLLSCKNVGLAPREHAPDQNRRAVKRFGGDPDNYRYHVLVVRPPGAKSDAPAQEIGVMPRHTCRGHSAYYGPASISGHPDGIDKGLLFGKYAGRFYVPQHLKGKKENGIVEKDYEVRGGAA